MPSSDCGAQDIKTSVVIPVYNTEAYLEECLESILAQTQTGIEVILVDDGSTDGSVAIIDRYARTYPFIRKVQQEHEFQGTARNRGLALARGQYVYFMDSDDRIDPRLFETCYEVCEAQGLDFVTFDAHGFLDTPDATPLTDIFDRRELGLSGRIWRGADFWTGSYNRRGILYLCWLHYIRRDFLLENNLTFEERTYFEDNDWTLRLYLAAERLRYLPEQLCDHRWRSGSNMNEGFTVDLMRGCFRMHDVLLRLLDEQVDDDKRSMVKDVMGLNVNRYDRLAEVTPDSRRIGLLQEFVAHVGEGVGTYESEVDRFYMCIATLRHIMAATRGWEDQSVHSAARDAWAASLARVTSLSVAGKRVGVYGMGKMSDRFVKALEDADALHAEVTYLDTNAPTGGTYRGRPVVNIADAPELGLDCVVVASTKYRDEMTAAARRVLGESVAIEQLPKDFRIFS